MDRDYHEIGLSRFQEGLAGAKAIVPLVLGAAPFGLIFGTLAGASGLSSTSAMAMSMFVFAGSAQFIALSLLTAGTALPLIVLTTFVVNLRHLLYAVSLIPHLRHLSQPWKLLMGFWLTDETFAVAIARYHQPDASPYKHWYFLGTALLMYGNWQVCTFVGLTLGQKIPNAVNWGLDFAMCVTFIGMVVPYLKQRPMLVTACVSGGVALFSHHLPHQMGLIIAAIVGASAGILTENIQMKFK